MCNRESPPAFIEALMGISTCGEYFELRREQEALLELLKIIQEEQAYPTLKIKNALANAWSLASAT
jgi:NADH:ubiquinone oxidoreductase subunit E